MGMRKREPTGALPRVSVEWLELKSGETLGGLVFRCPVRGCVKFRSSCGTYPPASAGDGIRLCRLPEARVIALERLITWLKYEAKP